MPKPALPLAATWVAWATCALLKLSARLLVSRLSASPAMAPLTVPLTLAPGAAVLPSYTLPVLPPMAATAVKALGVMLPATAVMVGAVKL